MSNDDEDSGFDFTENEMVKFHIWPLGVIPYYIDDFSFGNMITVLFLFSHFSAY